VKSHLDESLSPAFAGMAMRYETPGETTLYGPLVDQAALHGVLMRIRDLGLELLAVQQSTTNGKHKTKDTEGTENARSSQRI
jgi:hypothetical protein